MGANNADFVGGTGQVLYHGSRAMLRPGQYVMSPAERGKPNPRKHLTAKGTYNPGKVYVTPHYDLAQNFAGPEGYVYEVHPTSPLGEDHDLNLGAMKNGRWKAYTTDAAKVVRVVKKGDPIYGSDGDNGRAFATAGDATPRWRHNPNGYAGKCASCGERVEVGKGFLVRTGRKAANGKKYEVYHPEHLND